MFDGADNVRRVEDDTLRVLRHARDLVARPDGWCQGSAKAYRVVYSGDPLTLPSRVIAYCAYGALTKAMTDVAVRDDNALGRRTERFLIELIEFGSVAAWNDTSGRSQSEVVDLFDRAIAAAIPIHSHLEVIEHV